MVSSVNGVMSAGFLAPFIDEVTVFGGDVKSVTGQMNRFKQAAIKLGQTVLPKFAQNLLKSAFATASSTVATIKDTFAKVTNTAAQIKNNKVTLASVFASLKAAGAKILRLLH
jgi:hypothetical protein